MARGDVTLSADEAKKYNGMKKRLEAIDARDKNPVVRGWRGTRRVLATLGVVAIVANGVHEFGEIKDAFSNVVGIVHPDKKPAPTTVPSHGSGELGPILQFGAPLGEVVALRITTDTVGDVGSLAVAGAEVNQAFETSLQAA